MICRPRAENLTLSTQFRRGSSVAIKTFDEYVASLRRLKPTVYMFGEKIENPVSNPRIRAGINAIGATYEQAQDEKCRDLIVTTSPLMNSL